MACLHDMTNSRMPLLHAETSSSYVEAANMSGTNQRITSHHGPSSTHVVLLSFDVSYKRGVLKGRNLMSINATWVSLVC